jgi:hypothetical protein
MKIKTLPIRTYGTQQGSHRGKFVAMSSFVKISERSLINNLMLHLQLLENQEQAKPKTSRRREIIKIRAKINEIETN